MNFSIVVTNRLTGDSRSVSAGASEPATMISNPSAITLRGHRTGDCPRLYTHARTPPRQTTNQTSKHPLCIVRQTEGTPPPPHQLFSPPSIIWRAIMSAVDAVAQLLFTLYTGIPVMPSSYAAR